MSAGSPLRAVLDQFRAGAGSLDEVARRSGLRRDLVDAAVDHLVRTGHLRAEALTAGCPDGGCGSCPSAGDRSACATGTAPAGPVLVALSRPRVTPPP